MRSIYILLTRSTTILSRLIHLVTKDAYTHVSISFEDDPHILYSSSRKNGYTLFPAGPCRESLDRGHYQNNDRIPCRLYELSVSDEVYDMVRQEVFRIIDSERRYHYNILGLLLCQMDIPFHRERHFFCSQFVSEVLSRSRALAFPKDTSLMKPGDYTRIPELSCRFEGRLYDLMQRRRVWAAA